MLAAAVALLALAGPPMPVGLSPNITANGDAESLRSTILELDSLGARFVPQSAMWKDLVKSDGTLQLDSIKADAEGAKALKWRSTTTLRAVDTSRFNKPDRLASMDLDDPEFLAAWRATVRGMAEQVPSDSLGLCLGNEVDIYLAAHPSERPKILNLFRIGRQEAKKVRPNLRVGVVTTWEGLGKNADLIRRIHEGMDMVVMTYYPPADTADLAAAVPAHFRQMLDVAGTRKLILQEIGLPASEALGSSEAKQADFVDLVFAELRRNQSRLDAANFFLYCDFSPDVLAELTRYYGLSNKEFVEFLGSLGFIRNDGTPRLAWSRFKVQMRR